MVNHLDIQLKLFEIWILYLSATSWLQKHLAYLCYSVSSITSIHLPLFSTQTTWNLYLCGALWPHLAFTSGKARFTSLVTFYFFLGSWWLSEMYHSCQFDLHTKKRESSTAVIYVTQQMILWSSINFFLCRSQKQQKIKNSLVENSQNPN